MLRRAMVSLALFAVFACITAEAYTVVLKKNGKVIQGSLVSEDDNGIVFKDQQGLQYSLKKSALDLEKMKEANTPPPPPPPPAEQPAAAEPKKGGRTYTAADLEALRDKYGDLATSDRPAEFSDPSSGPEGYYRALMEAVTAMTEVANDLGSISDGMNTDWEVSSSTGRDPKESLKNYKAGKAYADTLKGANAGLSNLQGIVSEMQSPPKGMEKGYEAVVGAVDALYAYSEAIQRFSGEQDMASFRSTAQSYSSKVDAAIAAIQAIPVPTGVAPAPEESEEEQPAPEE